ncbi:hypothetical protein ES703_02617 [subsurface metagenome]
MKVKSVSDLAFKAIDELTNIEDELWVAHLIFNCEATRTGEIQKFMKENCVKAHAVQHALRTLVAKGIIIRVYTGKYQPNLKMILDKMLELLEAEGEKNDLV